MQRKEDHQYEYHNGKRSHQHAVRTRRDKKGPPHRFLREKVQKLSQIKGTVSQDFWPQFVLTHLDSLFKSYNKVFSNMVSISQRYLHVQKS